MRRLLTIITCLLLLSCGVVASAQTVKKTTRVVIDDLQVSTWVTDNMSALKIPSIAVGIVGPDRDHYLETFGPAEVTDPFLIGSLTKSVTAMAVMLLVHEGEISLEDPASKWVDGVPAEVTVLDLLHQTSGLDRSDGGVAWTDLNMTLQQAVDAATWEQRGTYNYSNLNYQILGHIVERVSDERYADFVRQRIFEPLGMKKSTAEPGVPEGNRVVGYQYMYGFPVAFGEPDYNAMTIPSGFVWMSGEDMATWLRVFVNGGRIKGEQIIPAEVVEQMLEKPAQTPYAMGWSMSPGAPMIARHNGATGAFTSAMSVVPEHEFGVFVFANLNSWMALGPTNVMNGIIASILRTDRPTSTNLEFILRLLFGVFVAVIVLTFLFEFMRWIRVRSFKLNKKQRNAVILTFAINIAVVVGVVYYFQTPISVIVATQPDIGIGFLVTVVLGSLRRLLTGFNKTFAEDLIHAEP